ncbi:unnamed protein product [Ilex paraguariensis]|uniref:Uncharacterized protein n=1 Tax=Ilex paraguariensis TaxID=185542 RepID=A0ABC8SYP3_9AQUA
MMSFPTRKKADDFDSSMSESRRKRKNDVGPSPSEPRKKNKNYQHSEAIGVRNVTCKRQVDRLTLGPTNIVVQTIENHSLHLWFQEVKGYVHPLCREFYQDLVVVDVLDLLRISMRGKAINVTLASIVVVLKYKRPNANKNDCPHPQCRDEVAP